MYFPQFLVGTTAIAVSIAISSYLRTGSSWWALASAAIIALLLQIGYFVILIGLILLAEPTEKTIASPQPSLPDASLPGRLVMLVALALLATLAMTDMTRADDDDAYVECVLGKAQAIMKTQATKDTEKALKKAYTLCQPLAGSQEARLDGVSPGNAQLL